MEESLKNVEETGVVKPKRPFLLTLISLFSFTFFGFISFLFLLALFNSGWITEVLNKYLPENVKSRTGIFTLILAGFVLHALSIAGSAMIWRMKKAGYIIFAISGLIITSYQLFQTKISFMTTGIYIVLIIAFGLFYKKLK